jgi:hypothetical protein
MGRGPSDSADEATLIGTTAQYSGVTVQRYAPCPRRDRAVRVGFMDIAVLNGLPVVAVRSSVTLPVPAEAARRCGRGR